MKKTSIRNINLATAIVSLIFAGIIFTYAEGYRRYYSGGFFALIGIVMLINVWRWSKEIKAPEN